MDSMNYYANLANANVVATATGDVNGDGVADFVYLTGVKTADSPYIQNITLVVRDGRTGMVQQTAPKTNAGYNPTLFLGDFTGNGVNDILIGMNSGGSGGMMYYYIYSDMHNRLQMLFDYEAFNEMYQYDVQYLDYFRVAVTNKTNHIRYIIDITYKGENYLRAIYDENGKLKKPITGFVNPIGGLYPIDFDGNGVYELFIFQRIAGQYNADGLGYVQTTLKWNGQQFVFEDQFVAVYGGKV